MLPGKLRCQHIPARRRQYARDLIGNYGRFAEKAMRVAMLLASISNQNRIELAHWARAQTIVERWRANLHNLADQLAASGPSEERQLQEKVIAVVARKGASTPAEIGRFIRSVSGPEVDEICRKLARLFSTSMFRSWSGRRTQIYDLQTFSLWVQRLQFARLGH